MSNENETEKKFLSDIEKATALSLETKALEDFRRRKLNTYHSAVDGPTTHQKSNSPSITLEDYQKILKQRQLSLDSSVTERPKGFRSAGIAPPPSFQSRRNSVEIRSTPPKSEKEQDDLISFTSPTSTSTDSAQTSFDQLCDEINKINIRANASMDVTGQFSMGRRSAGSENDHSMQVVPYTAAQQKPLTAEELKKLYSMNYAVQPRSGLMMTPPIAYQPQTSASYYPYMAHTSSPIPGGMIQQFNHAFMRPSVSPINIPQPIGFVAQPSRPTVELPSFTARQNQQQSDLTPSPSTSKNVLTPLAQSASTSANHSSSLYTSTSYSEIPRSRKNNETTKKKGDNLIDLDFDNNSRVDVLEAFDPLLSCDQSDTASEYYYEDDPFDYLYSAETTCSDPVYDAVINKEPTSREDRDIKWPGHSQTPSSPPPLPPRNSDEVNGGTLVLDRRKYPEKLYQNIVIDKSYDPELVAFYEMVVNVRSTFKYDNEETNVGFVVATEFPNTFPDDLSIKLIVHPALECLTTFESRGQIEGYGPPVVFTSSISATVEHVLIQVLCSLENKTTKKNAKDFILRPIGIIEWMQPTSRNLTTFECVHDSFKLEKDVQLCLWPKDTVNLHAIARSQADDRRDLQIKLENILPNETPSTINYDSLMIILETLETEIDRLESTAADTGPHSMVSCAGVVQAIKAVCSLLGYIETLEITEVANNLKAVCSRSYEPPTYGNKIDVISDHGDYAEVALRPRTLVEQIRYRCNHIRDAVSQLLDTYSKAFRVDFCVKTPIYPSSTISLSNVSQSVMVSVGCLYRLPPYWKYDDYLLGTQIYHGTRYIGDAMVTKCLIESVGSYPRLKFKSWLYFENIPVCVLPRESRLLFVLYGCTNNEPESGQNEPKSDQTDVNRESRQTKTELGWFSIQFFDFDRKMINGSYFLPMWPPTTDKYLGPAPARGTHPYGNQFPVLGIEIPEYGGQIVFPESIPGSLAPKLDFNSLDVNLQQELIDTAEQGYPIVADKREVLWEKRYYLQNLPHALPKVLHAAHSWDYASLVDLHALIRSWSPLSPLQALELFLPRYPDLEIRYHAVAWFSKINNDEFVEFLPQLVQGLKHDTYEGSPMAKLLLSRSLECPRIAHHLYWLLSHSLPGEMPQNSSLETSMNNVDMDFITQSRYFRRNQLLLRALLATCGEKLLSRFMSQKMLCRTLGEIAQSVKTAKNKQHTLVHSLDQIHQNLIFPTALPLNPGQEVVGVISSQSSYFNSNTLPLKISFLGPDQQVIPAIFKSGDDLQQDMLTLQLVRLMDRLWLQEGLDLKMVTFNCIPTSNKKGMIELVSNAETLRKIQVEWGLTGSFKDKPIAEWLAKQNPSQLEYQRAVDNFTVSCAGYSVATYILGICDRHNDNIMLKTSGHIFHIDFGKFLGDAQMFGNFKRDRTPFVLTSDMAYVINNGDKPSTKFHHFVDLCCQAFNIVRKHNDLLLHMLALMATSGIPGVTANSVNYVRKALLPGQSNAEAAASFAKMIHISLKSWFTQFNFFLHNLAQLKFSAEEGSGELLSFVPRTYTMAQDGRLKSVTVHGYQKRYDLEKYYTYILKVTRQNQPDPAYLFRSYKEFLEFHQKLCLDFPLAKLHSLPSGLHVGRSNIKTVAERRLPEIRQFLQSLFMAADEIAHSDLVYTFFHPLLRDQQDANIHAKKVKENKTVTSHENVRGEIMFSVQYHRGALTVMIRHARSLPVTTGGQEPNTYVKCYLKPDNSKSTKRKTKVVRKSCCPSFMETLEYRMPLEIIHLRSLEVTVWSHDSLQENEFLGGVQLVLREHDLREELLKWFPLSYIPRS